jgi:protein-tyrosine phosphatase
MEKTKRILFICYANTCRSPAAEYLARHYAKQYELDGLKFNSAGWHDPFDYAQPETVAYVEEKGIDMSDFKPKLITRELVEKQDLILGMAKYHIIKLRKTFRDLRSQLKGKIFTLKQYNGADKSEWNIPDPYKKDLETYNNILKEVETNVKLFLKNIKKNEKV